MTRNKFLFLIKRLDYVQSTAAVEIGVGGFISVGTSTIPKDRATWLHPASTTLKLSNNRTQGITDEDVYTTLALPMGLIEVQVALTCEPKNKYIKLLEQYRRRWNLGRTGTPKVGMMFLVDVNQIAKYNWCAHLLKCLNDTVVEWKQNHTRYFRGPLLFLMTKEMQKSMVSHSKHWTTDAVEQRNKDGKKFLGKYGRGKTSNRIDYPTIIREENHVDIEPSASTHDPLPAPQLPCLECGSESNVINTALYHLVSAKMYRTDYTSSTFDLGIPLSPEQRILTVITCPIKRTCTIISSPTYIGEQVCLGDSQGQYTSMHDIILLCNILNCCIPKHNRRRLTADNRLKTMYSESQIFNAVYCICICINGEELYELNTHDEAHIVWIDKEAIALMVATDLHLENNILDVWCIIMNKD
ncbi:LOW QUALITY PROTEIN: hypothetical protein Cgig2_015659 [Carnegiea gigantea]|uniref:Uncharacterized protein n=1 Tax=Carnegiea gigantea TaxID=171969 RepID=A0A9Q1JHD3_9CARY|nr:LOW QUALITY PROTEIN: hypothetical protein Cgig2_015659 [Carnegiea gigantea]